MSSRSNVTSTKRQRAQKSPASRERQTVVLCLRNYGYEVGLERRKIYEALHDRDAAAHGQFRVIDESGEDYLYPASYFAAITLSPSLRRAVLSKD